MKYKTIVIDPPWEVKRGPEYNSNGKSRILIYPTMTVEQIKNLPVKTLADKNAHLYLWTINKYIEQSYLLVREWGFTPSQLLVWCKAPMGLGLGGTYSSTTEYILFCRRGVQTSYTRFDSTWWKWKRGRHSQKPEAFIDMVMTVSPHPYLEMFARRVRLGWDAWGNEITSDITL